MSEPHADRLTALFDAHADRLYRLARRLVPSADDALDLVQETFLKGARSRESIPYGASHEEAWLVRVLVNIRRDEWRREAVRKRHVHVRHESVQRDDPEARLVIRTTVWKALDWLPPRRRTVVVLHEVVVGNDDIAQSWVIDGGSGRFGVGVELLPSGAERMRQATAGHVGRPVAILVDGRIALAPVVRSPIGESAVISGNYTQTEAERIADGITRP